MWETVKAIGLLIGGFILLIKGADFFVDGSSSVAKRLRIPSMIIGLTIVAMGTSLPELAVSAPRRPGNNELAVSNVSGSNIFNLIVVCGFCSLFMPLAVDKKTLKTEFPFSILCAILLLGLGYVGMSLDLLDGIILLVIFAAYLGWMVYSALKARASSEKNDEYKIMPVWKCILFIVGGIAAIAFGGDFVVDGASYIAEKLGMSETLIGLTIVAVGTSLPELVTSVVAARKKEADLAIGNVIGSNIFNILLILGAAAPISAITLTRENIIDICVLIGLSIIVWLFSWTKKKITMPEGIVMLLTYAGYMVYACLR